MNRSPTSEKTRVARRTIWLVVAALATIVIAVWINGRDATHPMNAADDAEPSIPIDDQDVPQQTAIRFSPDRTDSRTAEFHQLTQKHEPRHDEDWHSEIQSDAVVGQLTTLARVLELRQNSVSDFKALAAGNLGFSFPDVRQSVKVFDDSGIAVYRAQNDTKRYMTESSDALVWLSDRTFIPDQSTDIPDQSTEETIDRRVKFKLYRIQPTEDGAETLVRFEYSRQRPSKSEQQTAIWNCRWRFPGSADSAPLLTSVVVLDWEQVTVNKGKLFGDSTLSVLGKDASYEAQMLPGIPHWLSRLPKAYLGQLGHHGLAVGDVNGDGLDDLYVCDAGGLPNRLYVQQPDGTARDTSADAQVDFLEDTVSALLVDLDNDNDQDLVVATALFVQFAENNGAGRFRLRSTITVDTDAFSMSAADFDADGSLDIFVCGYEARRNESTGRNLPFPIPYHDANNGGRNVLLRNAGNFRFTDVTDKVGLSQHNSRFSMAASWDDFDNDGDLDLYVANDFGRNNLYRNDNGRFIDIASSAGVEDVASGMSVACGDFNRDGRVDIYVGNMFSGAGNRITFQRRFETAADEVTVAQLQRMARGNTLFANLGNGTFRDVSEAENVTMGRWAWGSQFADFTNDGWLDLVIANGYITNEDSGDL